SGYRLVISDNSGDAEKAKYLRALMTDDNLIYIEKEPCDVLENWATAFEETEGTDFVLLMGDDDMLFRYGPSPSFEDVPDDVVGIRPAIFGYADLQGIICVNGGAIEAENASERIMEHLEASKGANIG